MNFFESYEDTLKSCDLNRILKRIHEEDRFKVHAKDFLKDIKSLNIYGSKDSPQDKERYDFLRSRFNLDATYKQTLVFREYEFHSCDYRQDFLADLMPNIEEFTLIDVSEEKHFLKLEILFKKWTNIKKIMMDVHEVGSKSFHNFFR